MCHSIERVLILAVCLLFWGQSALASPDDEITIVKTFDGASAAHVDGADVVYRVAMLAGVGWRGTDIAKITRDVEEIFDQCRITVAAGEMHWLETGAEFHILDEALESRLLGMLPPDRPIVLLVDRTTNQDLAYAYVRTAPPERRDTAWITQTVPDACLAPLMAHELGHILLDSTDHSDDPGNLMHHSCTVSNISGARAGTLLTEAQCERIRESL